MNDQSSQPGLLSVSTQNKLYLICIISLCILTSIPTQSLAQDPIVHTLEIEYYNGNTHVTKYLPTSITDKDLVKVKLATCSTEAATMTIIFDGEWKDGIAVGAASTFRGIDAPACITKEIVFGPYGPFNTDLSVALVNTTDGKELHKSIANVRKHYYVFAGVGVNRTSLSAPENIVHGPISGSQDSTLYADNTGVRGVLSLNAIFFPFGGRQVISKKWGLNRLGFQVGLRLDEEQFDNLFVGLAYNFAPGTTFTIGSHFANVNTVRGDDDFVFGETTYEGDVESAIKKEWKNDLYFGLNIDFNIFTQTLKQ